MAGIELATGYVSIVSDTKGLGRQLIADTKGYGASAGQQAGSAFSSSFGSVAKGVGKVALAGLAVGVGATASALGYAAKKGIDFNATMEQSRTAFRVLLKDVKKADKALADIYEYEAKTPFNIEEVTSAGRAFATVGLNVKDTLGWVGDLAAVAPASAGGLTEVARAISRLKSGDFGESFERLRDFGISRADLEGAGLVFDKGGQYQGSVDQALAAVEKIVKTKFAGMAEEQGKTFSGMLSSLQSNVSKMFGAAATPLFDWLKATMPGFSSWIQTDVAPKLSGIFAGITAELKGIDWKAAARGVMDFIDGFEKSGGIKTFVDGVKNAAGAVDTLGSSLGPGGAGASVGSFLGALGNVLTYLSTLITRSYAAGQSVAALGFIAKAWATGDAALMARAQGALAQGMATIQAEAQKADRAITGAGSSAQKTAGDFGTATAAANTWNKTPVDPKAAKASMPTADIDHACQAAHNWNNTPLNSKTAKVVIESQMREFRAGERVGAAKPTATGGYFPRATNIIIGEGNGPEWAVSADPRYRAQNLGYLAQAAQALGVKASSGGITIGSVTVSVPDGRLATLVREIELAVSQSVTRPTMVGA